MIREIKNFLLISIVSLSSNMVLESMEEHETQSSSHINQVAPKTLSKSQKKRQNRNKNSRAKNKDIVNLKLLEDFVQNGNLREKLNFTGTTVESKKTYIKQLNFLANILLMQQWATDNLRAISKDIGAILRTVIQEGDLNCISITDDGHGICGHSKDELGEGTTSIIQTPLVRDMVAAILAPMILEGKSSSKNYLKCCELIKDRANQSPDMITFAIYTKTLTEYFQAHGKIKIFTTDFYNLTIKLLSRLYSIGDIGDALEHNATLELHDAFNKLCCKAKMQHACKEIIPFFLPLHDRINEFKLLVDETESAIKFEPINEIYNKLRSIINWWDPLQEKYKALYQKIASEQAETLQAIPAYSPHKLDVITLANQVYLYPPMNNAKQLPKSLILEESVEQVDKANQNSFIDDITKIKNVPQSSPTPKKRKKSRKRPHKKVSALAPEELKDTQPIKEQIKKLEHIKFPCYADRVINRFNQSTNNNDLYHTFSPISDAFIIKYGTSKRRQNKTFNNQIDTKFSLLGKVELKDGTTIFGKFGITLGIDNVCYHRQFKCSGEKEDSDFANIKFDADFPSLISEDIHYTSARLLFDAQNDEIYGEKRLSESSECIVIEDARNEVIITLFKTQNNNTIQ